MVSWVLVASLAGTACGGTSRGDKPDEDVAPGPDVLADVHCKPWRPSDADWSALPAARPAILGTLSASPSGRYTYTVGTWWEAGQLEHRALRSADLGDSWCVLETPAPVTDVATALDDERALYALGLANRGESPPLLRSADGGDTWDVAAGALPNGVSGIVASAGGLLVGDSSAGSDIAPLLSVDGGDSWLEATPPELKLQVDPAKDLVFASVTGALTDPKASGRLLVWGIWQSPSDNTTRIRFFSSNGGRAMDWLELDAPPLPEPESPASTPQVAVDSAGTLYATVGEELARSDDWGKSWTRLARLPHANAKLSTLGASKAGVLALTVEPDGDGAVAGAWLSSDRGGSWRALDVASSVVPVLLPRNGNVVLGVTINAFAHSNDGGESWQIGTSAPAPAWISQSELAPTRLWGVDPMPWQPVRTYGVVASPAYQSSDGGLTWSSRAAVSGRLLFDGKNGDAVLAGLATNSPRRSEDAGKTWSDVERVGAVQAAASCAAPDSCQYALNQDGFSTTLPCYLSKTEDLGRSWGERLLVPSELCYGTPVMAVAPDAPDHLLAACGPAVCVSRDGGKTFKRQPIGNDPVRYVGAILPLAGGAILVSTWSIAQPGDTAKPVVARSEDGGDTWTDVLESGAESFAASVAHPETAFAFERVSNAPNVVYRTDDTGLTWQRISPDVTPPFGTALEFFTIADGADGGFLAATTHGLLHFR